MEDYKISVETTEELLEKNPEQSNQFSTEKMIINKIKKDEDGEIEVVQYADSVITGSEIKKVVQEDYENPMIESATDYLELVMNNLKIFATLE